MAENLPVLGSVWKHGNGNAYTVCNFLNLARDKTKPDDHHPVIVCYSGSNGNLWGKPLAEFLAKMKPVV